MTLGGIVGKAALRTPRLRRFVSHVVDGMVNLARVPPPGLRGTNEDDPAADSHPVVLLVQLGADETGVGDTVSIVPAIAAAAGVRVVLVLDRPHLAIARRGGVIVELVPDHAAWERRHPEASWDEHLERRLAMLRRDYTAQTAVPVPREGLSALDPVTVIEALRRDPPQRRPASSWRRARIALVRLVDRPERR